MSEDTPQNLLIKARKRAGEGKFADALALAEKAGQNIPEANFLAGQCQRALGRPGEAEKTFETLIKKFPQTGEIYTELALAKWDLKNPMGALKMAEKGAELAKNPQFSLDVLAKFATALQQWPKAIKAHEEFLSFAGETPQTLYQMAMLYFQAGEFGKAIPAFENVLEKTPQDDRSLFFLARCHIQLGDMKRGEELAKKAVAIKPDRVHNPTLLMELNPGAITDETLKSLSRRLAGGNFEETLEEGLIHLFFGKYYQHKGEVDKAFAEFQMANEGLRKGYAASGQVYDPRRMEARVENAKTTFSRENLKKMAGAGSDSEVPIFIASPPRSGTTLLEGIIASHSKAFGAGEFSGMNPILFDLGARVKENPNRPVSEFVRDNAKGWAGQYLAALNLPEGAIRATDKMPANILYLGLFQAMFPKARVIYIRRNPLDTCFSMFINNLSATNPFTTRLEDLGHYLNLHAGLMAFWRQTLDLPILDIAYEDLVAKPEEKAREVIAFCELKWEAGILDFHTRKKAAYTLSQVQVSEPINKKGIGRWKPYKKYLGPLIEALDEGIVGPLGADD